MGRKLAELKKCRRCGEVKPRSEYSKHGVSPNGVHSYCKPCCAEIAKERYNRKPKQETAIINRRSKLKRIFGITLEQYDAMLEKQNGGCAICGTTTPGGMGKNRGSFAIDHCHKTGAIRGLLCNMCNVGLGHLKESVEFLGKAIEYLNRGGAL